MKFEITVISKFGNLNFTEKDEQRVARAAAKARAKEEKRLRKLAKHKRNKALPANVSGSTIQFTGDISDNSDSTQSKTKSVSLTSVRRKSKSKTSIKSRAHHRHSSTDTAAHHRHSSTDTVAKPQELPNSEMNSVVEPENQPSTSHTNPDNLSKELLQSQKPKMVNMKKEAKIHKKTAKKKKSKR